MRRSSNLALLAAILLASTAAPERADAGRGKETLRARMKRDGTIVVKATHARGLRRKLGLGRTTLIRTELTPGAVETETTARMTTWRESTTAAEGGGTDSSASWSRGLLFTNRSTDDKVTRAGTEAMEAKRGFFTRAIRRSSVRTGAPGEHQLELASGGSAGPTMKIGRGRRAISRRNDGSTIRDQVAVRWGMKNVFGRRNDDKLVEVTSTKTATGKTMQLEAPRGTIDQAVTFDASGEVASLRASQERDQMERKAISAERGPDRSRLTKVTRRRGAGNTTRKEVTLERYANGAVVRSTKTFRRDGTLRTERVKVTTPRNDGGRWRNVARQRTSYERDGETVKRESVRGRVDGERVASLEKRGEMRRGPETIVLSPVTAMADGTYVNQPELMIVGRRPAGAAGRPAAIDEQPITKAPATAAAPTPEQVIHPKVLAALEKQGRDAAAEAASAPEQVIHPKVLAALEKQSLADPGDKRERGNINPNMAASIYRQPTRGERRRASDALNALNARADRLAAAADPAGRPAPVKRVALKRAALKHADRQVTHRPRRMTGQGAKPRRATGEIHPVGGARRAQVD